MGFFFFFYQINVKGNDDSLVTLQLWSVKGYFPNAFSSTIIGKPTKTAREDVWEGLDLLVKPRTFCNTRIHMLMHSCLDSCRSLVCQVLCLIAGSHILPGKEVQEGGTLLKPWASPIPPTFLPPVLVSPVEEYGGLGPSPWGIQLKELMSKVQ